MVILVFFTETSCSILIVPCFPCYNGESPLETFADNSEFGENLLIGSDTSILDVFKK